MASTLTTSPYLLICFLSIFITVRAAGTPSQTQKCDILDKAISQMLAKRTGEYNKLFDLMGVGLRMDNFILGTYEKSSGLKFMSSPSARHQLACKLAGAKSREDVAKIMGRQKWQIDNLYVEWQAPVLNAGSIRKLDDIVKVTTLLFIWGQNSGYPIMPFKNLNDAAFLKTFNAIKKVMMAKHVHDWLINAPFPLKVTPNRALEKLKTAKSYGELERGLFLEPGSLVAFANEVRSNPGILQASKEEVGATMQLLKVLDSTGILWFAK